MRASEFISEEWSEKYKRSINCAHPRGFSQRAHCQGRKKNEDIDEHIVKHGSGYRLVSKKSGKNLGDFPSRAAAEKHEREVEYFKHRADEGLNEFAPGADDNRENNPEDVLFRFAKMWYSAPNIATQQRVEQALAKIGWEIGELESEEGGAYVMQIGDDAGDSYIGWSEEQLADQLNELTFKGSPCTKDCSGHRAGYEWSRKKGGVDAASWSRSFNNGAALFKNGY